MAIEEASPLLNIINTHQIHHSPIIHPTTARSEQSKYSSSFLLKIASVVSLIGIGHQLANLNYFNSKALNLCIHGITVTSLSVISGVIMDYLTANRLRKISSELLIFSATNIFPYLFVKYCNFKI